MKKLSFQIETTNSGSPARIGRLRLFHPHGEERVVLETPAFMPVGTQAAVKAAHPSEVWSSGTRMLLCNTYHLMNRPGEDIISALGGLHRFMNWQGGIITDSGGFQVYSLARRCSVDDDGVTFQHH